MSKTSLPSSGSTRVTTFSFKAGPGLHGKNPCSSRSVTLYHQSACSPGRPFSVTPSLPKNPGNSTGFIGKKCFHPGCSPTPPTGNWRVGTGGKAKVGSPKTRRFPIRPPEARDHELHGSTLRNYCTRCKKKNIPSLFCWKPPAFPGALSLNCGAIVRPDGVLFLRGLTPM